MPQNDPIGLAVTDYFKHGKAKQLLVHSSQFDDDELPVSYLFRKWQDMPDIEKTALDKCTGKVLDIGACAGAHALILQERSLDVLALDISGKCCEVMVARGIKKIIQGDIYKVDPGHFDTILLLMNGTGLAGTMQNLPFFLKRLRGFLNKGGQVLIDSSDLKYLYEEDDGSYLFNLNDDYYGEIYFQMNYGGIKGEVFPWLYVDPDSLASVAKQCGFTFEILNKGPHYDYLARLIIM